MLPRIKDYKKRYLPLYLWVCHSFNDSKNPGFKIQYPIIIWKYHWRNTIQWKAKYSWELVCLDLIYFWVSQMSNSVFKLLHNLHFIYLVGGRSPELGAVNPTEMIFHHPYNSEEHVIRREQGIRRQNPGANFSACIHLC